MNKNSPTDGGREPIFENQRTQLLTKNRVICCFVLTIILSVPSIFALSLPEFSLSPFTEITYGEAFEYVYEYDKLLSELVWDMKPVYFMGLDASVQWKKGLAVKAEASYGLPMFTGSMEDSDWENLYFNLDTGKNRFSHHNANLESATVLVLNAGWNFSTENQGSGIVTFTPSVGYRYFSWKWNGQDGYLQHNPDTVNGMYPEWKESQPKVPVQGTVISYQQNFYIPTFGLSSSFSPTQKFKAELGLTFSPFVSSHNIDHHFYPTSGRDYRKSTRFDKYNDILTDGIFFEPSFSIHWFFAKNINFYITARKTTISNLRGNSHIIKAGSSSVQWDLQEDGNGSGAALDTTSLRLGCVFNLL